MKVRRGGKQKYDWKATIEAIDGGLMETRDEFMYRAPENGYAPRIEVSMPSSSPDWSVRQKASYYLRVHDGRCYGRMTIEFRTDSERATTGVTITSALNPTGSRNLE